MANIELLEKSIPVAPIRIAALDGCRPLAEEVDKKLVRYRRELASHRYKEVVPQGDFEKSLLQDCERSRFGTGEGKGRINESVRDLDVFLVQLLKKMVNYLTVY